MSPSIMRLGAAERETGEYKDTCGCICVFVFLCSYFCNCICVFVYLSTCICEFLRLGVEKQGSIRYKRPHVGLFDFSPLCVLNQGIYIHTGVVILDNSLISNFLQS